MIGSAFVLGTVGTLAAQNRLLPPQVLERFQHMLQEAEAKGLAEPFRGVTTGGATVPGLYGIRSMDVSTRPVRDAALAFQASLSPEQRAGSIFPVNDDEWRRWANRHFYLRQGVTFGEMSPRQRQAAVALLRASLSAKGLRQSRDIMRLNTICRRSRVGHDRLPARPAAGPHRRGMSGTCATVMPASKWMKCGGT